MEGKGKVEITDEVIRGFIVAYCVCDNDEAYNGLSQMIAKARAEGYAEGKAEFAEKVLHELEDASNCEIECKADRAYVEGLGKAREIVEQLRKI